MPHDPQTRPEECCPPPAGELHRVLHTILTSQQQITRHLHRIEKQMADIQQSVTDLQTIDTAVLAALGGGVQQLQAQLAQAQSDLTALQAIDANDVAERDDAIAKLAQSQADTQTAADSVEAEVSKLSAAIGTTPPTT